MSKTRPSSHDTHAARHHRRRSLVHHAPQASGQAVEGAEVAGAAALPSVEKLGALASEKAGLWAEEMLHKVPNPMMAGLGIGLLVGASVAALMNRARSPASEGHAARLDGEHDSPRGHGR